MLAVDRYSLLRKSKWFGELPTAPALRASPGIFGSTESLSNEMSSGFLRRGPLTGGINEIAW